MDTLKQYRQIIKDVINEYAQYKPSVGDVETEVVFDESNDHYELVHSGWVKIYRIHGPVLHIDIRGGKVWIQHDGTEDGVAEEFVKRGIPREHIVLAFKHPEIRRFTDFAMA